MGTATKPGDGCMVGAVGGGATNLTYNIGDHNGCKDTGIILISPRRGMLVRDCLL